MLSVLDDGKPNPDIHIRQNDRHQRAGLTLGFSIRGLTQEVIEVKAVKIQLPPAAQMKRRELAGLSGRSYDRRRIPGLFDGVDNKLPDRDTTRSREDLCFPEQRIGDIDGSPHASEISY